jgi:hypothetical protein
MGEITVDNIIIELRPKVRECTFHKTPPTYQVKVNGAWLDACDICKSNYLKNYNKPGKAVRKVI